MEQLQIIFNIKDDGTVESEVIGAEGEACLIVTQAIEQALGTVEHREAKPEMYQSGGGQASNTQSAY